MLKEKKPFNTSTKILSLNESSVKPQGDLQVSRQLKSPEELERKFIELYNENQKLMQKKEKLRQELWTQKQQKEMQQCTFHPQVNPQIDSFNISGSGSFLKREIDWMSKRQRKIQQITRESQRKLKKQCSFRPRISRKSYAMLFNNNTATKSSNTRSHATLTPYKENGVAQTFRQSIGSYREIHLKKEQYKQLIKSGSFQEFTLMTAQRYQQKSKNSVQRQEKESLSSHVHEEQFSFSSISLPQTVNQLLSHQQYEDYIQNIVIKIDDQDTFNSMSSLEMKSQRKVDVEMEENVRIFQEQLEEELEEEEEEGENQDNGEEDDGENVDDQKEVDEEQRLPGSQDQESQQQSEGSFKQQQNDQHQEDQNLQDTHERNAQTQIHQ